MAGMFSWLKGKKPLSEQEKQALITELMLEMAVADGEADEAEISHLVQLLAARYGQDASEIRQRIAAMGEVSSRDIAELSSRVKKYYSMIERVQVLRDLWAIALANGVADAYEERLFHQVATRIGITDQEFLDNCIKVKQQF